MLLFDCVELPVEVAASMMPWPGCLPLKQLTATMRLFCTLNHAIAARGPTIFAFNDRRSLKIREMQLEQGNIFEVYLLDDPEGSDSQRMLTWMLDIYPTPNGLESSVLCK